MLTIEEEKRLLDACRIEKKTVPYVRVCRRGGQMIEEKVTQIVPVDRKRLIPLIVCALDTAMRRGEIFNLEWRQIDLENRIIYLTEEAAAETKTGAEGVLPMTTRLFEILSEMKSRAKGRKVFTPYNYRKAFTGACRDAGIEDFQFRDLRSTGATRMVLAGNPESQVMKVTRHRQLKIFLEHYTNVDVKNAQRIGAKLDDFLEKEDAQTEAEGQGKRPDVP